MAGLITVIFGGVTSWWDKILVTFVQKPLFIRCEYIENSLNGKKCLYFGIVDINFRMMKVRIALFFLIVFGASACSQYTCPTYSKDDTTKTETAEDRI